MSSRYDRSRSVYTDSIDGTGGARSLFDKFSLADGTSELGIVGDCMHSMEILSTLGEETKGPTLYNSNLIDENLATNGYLHSAIATVLTIG
jgi:hypothetical protein